MAPPRVSPARSTVTTATDAADNARPISPSTLFRPFPGATSRTPGRNGREHQPFNPPIPSLNQPTNPERTTNPGKCLMSYPHPLPTKNPCNHGSALVAFRWAFTASRDFSPSNSTFACDWRRLGVGEMYPGTWDACPRGGLPVPGCWEGRCARFTPHRRVGDTGVSGEAFASCSPPFGVTLSHG